MRISPPKRKRVVSTPNVLPDALVGRFAADVARLIGDAGSQRFAIAVSGGPDSLALLLLAAAAFPQQVEAATVDHRLRAASADEAAFVARLCTERGIPHSILTLDRLPQGNLSAEARKARYAVLDAWADARGLDWLMTAHHADDQRETMIMRLNRGAGVGGLSCIRARQGRIVRPLLNWRHRELCEIVTHAGIVAIDDPTNHDDAFDRARLRKLLMDVHWIDAEAVALSAAALADADAAIGWAVDRFAGQHVSHDGAAVIFDRQADDFVHEILRRLVLRCLYTVDPDNAPRGVALTRFIAALEQGATATLGTVQASGGKVWRFMPAAPRRPVRP